MSHEYRKSYENTLKIFSSESILYIRGMGMYINILKITAPILFLVD